MELIELELIQDSQISADPGFVAVVVKEKKQKGSHYQFSHQLSPCKFWFKMYWCAVGE